MCTAQAALGLHIIRSSSFFLALPAQFRLVSNPSRRPRASNVERQPFARRCITMTPASLYSDLTSKIGRVRTRERALGLQTGLLNALAAIITTCGLALTLEVVGRFDAPTRE